VQSAKARLAGRARQACRAIQTTRPGGGFAVSSFATGFGFSLVRLLISLLDIYALVIIVAALISWVNPDPYNPIVRILYKLTEPVFKPLRRLVPPRRLGGLDISPILALLIIQLVRYTIIYTVVGAPVGIGF
jgi:YggT family protein